MAFTKSETNPNADVGGGCIGMGGRRGYDCKPPYFTAEGVVGFNSTSPKIVLCDHCRGELNRIANDRQAVPAGYMKAEANAAERALVDGEPQGGAAKRPKSSRNVRKPSEDVSL